MVFLSRAENVVCEKARVENRGGHKAGPADDANVGEAQNLRLRPGIPGQEQSIPSFLAHQFLKACQIHCAAAEDDAVAGHSFHHSSSIANPTLRALNSANAS